MRGVVSLDWTGSAVQYTLLMLSRMLLLLLPYAECAETACEAICSRSSTSSRSTSTTSSRTTKSSQTG